MFHLDNRFAKKGEAKVTQYQPYNYKKKAMLIEQYLLLGELECNPQEYDLFDLSINSFATQKIMQIEENGYNGFQVFDDQAYTLLNIFRKYEEFKNKKIFLYAEIYSPIKTKSIVCETCFKDAKLWVNGKCIFAHHSGDPYFITIELSKGKNVFLLEQYSPLESTIFSIQLLNYRFEMSDHFKALSNLEPLVQIDQLILSHEPLYCPQKNLFRFMFMDPANKYVPEYQVKVYDSKIQLVKTLKARINEPACINVAELRGLHEETLRHNWLECTFKMLDGSEVSKEFNIYPNDFYNSSRENMIDISRVIEKQSREFRWQVQGQQFKMKYHEGKETHEINYWSRWRIKELLEQTENGAFDFAAYKKPGIHEFYIHSQLDDGAALVIAKIPSSYNKMWKYPVVFAFPVNFDIRGAGLLLGDIKELDDCLVFVVTGRGFTGGSYIGEASALEVMEWIFKHYNINSDRIYVAGLSNGGYATWALAQNYPHIAAAIYPLISFPDIDSIENLTNVPIFQLISPKDSVYMGRENAIKHRLKSYGNLTQYDFQEMMHHHLVPRFIHPDIWRKMLSYQRNQWPDHIIYRTVRNRHLESFWVKLHGIAHGKKHAKIVAMIDNPAKINICLQNADGVTVTIPPQVKRESFSICINNSVIAFSNYELLKVILRRKKGHWVAEEDEPMVDYRKGTGLLDIFMNSLRIIIPDNNSEVLLKTARNFSRPYTNTPEPEVFIEYPIYKTTFVPDHIFSHNLLLIESANYPSSYIRRFADKLPIQCNDTGYVYNGNRTESAYVVLQVIPNPYDNQRSILVLCTNNEGLLAKCRFTRNVVLPFYTNGIHPYWNNEALIFDGSKYFGVYEGGINIEEIK